jgi:hypothetical protein
MLRGFHVLCRKIIMAINEIHMYDANTTFEVQLLKEDSSPFPVDNASLMEVHFQKPDGILMVRPASYVTNGVDGLVKYTTHETDLDQPGLWRYQIYIIKGPTEKYSDIGTFKVYPNLPLE